VSLGGAVILAVVVVGRMVDAPLLLTRALGGIRGLGAWGLALFIGLYVVATVLLMPGSVLTLGAGAIFGVAKGVVVVSIAATLGATAAFLVGRYGAREWVTRRLKAYPAFTRIDEAVGREGWKIVGLARLSPVFPFNLLNYAFGLTRVSLRGYVVASWAGMLPGTVMYVYLGSLVGDLASLGAGQRVRTPAEWAFSGLGLLATVGVTLYVTRLARAALARRGAAG
jgi:uncharacterized membrane protein YdjX (TVP38/TMEM64 family)